RRRLCWEKHMANCMETSAERRTGSKALLRRLLLPRISPFTPGGLCPLLKTKKPCERRFGLCWLMNTDIIWGFRRRNCEKEGSIKARKIRYQSGFFVVDTFFLGSFAEDVQEFDDALFHIGWFLRAAWSRSAGRNVIEG